MAGERIFDPMWDDSPIDVSVETNFIWSIAKRLRGPYREDKYKDVVIPMVIIRRFECALEPTKEDVIEQYKKNPNFPVQAMYKISHYQFYNTSEFTLKELLNDSEHLAENFRSYIQAFSPNVSEILISKLGFFEQIKKLDECNRLLTIVKAFSELNLNPDEIDSMKMGYIFEDLIRRFSENSNAGDHYTGRDIIRLMVNILLAEGCDNIFDDGKVITILDQACGTGGMLSVAYNFIKRYNPTAEIMLFGQENNPESYAMCLAEMLIKMQDTNNIRYQDTLKADCFPDVKMRFVLENPPFGQPWKGDGSGDGDKEAVEEEYTKGFDGRWGAGLPAGGDSQMLFLQSAVDKMDDNNGRCAIIEDGSPLFVGSTASGESQIRRWLLESDLIEAIIELPEALFYNTGISTYIWILSKNKRSERKGKVQLIDATKFSHKLRKSLGDKRNEVTKEDRAAITQLYSNFEENEYCKIFNNEDFLYREYAVMQPLQRSYAITEERINSLLGSKAMTSFYNEVKVEELQNLDKLAGKEQKQLDKFLNNKPIYDAIIDTLTAAISDAVYMSPGEFLPVLTDVLNDVTTDRKLISKIAEGLSVVDKSAEIQRDKKGNIIYDPETKDAEIVAYNEDIDDYMAREVLPHIPDAKAFFEENTEKKNPVIRTGAEIPFTRYFYKYQQPAPSDEMEGELEELATSVSERMANLFK